MNEIVEGIADRGWIHVTGAVSSADLLSINEFFENKKQEFIPASVGKDENRKRLSEIRGDHTFWLDPQHPPEAFSKIISFLDELKQNLNRELFLGLKEYECHLAAYPPGTFYKKHLDKHEAGSSRAVSFIFYLHQSWKKGDGGELVLYDQDQNVIHEVGPLPGSFICFLSDKFPHEVKTSHMERRSLTGWIHTKIIT